MNTNKNIRPLGLVMEAIEKMGLQVTYAYDDLIFVEHNAFLLQFRETDGVNVYFNLDCGDTDIEKVFRELMFIASDTGIDFYKKGKFSMQQNEGKEDFELTFFDF